MDLLEEVTAALTLAGLAIAPPVGVGVDVLTSENGVMLSWGMSDDADYRTVGIMLGAVAEVLRVHGFAVEQHPYGLAYVVTGRR
jgi:hypothetical protein